MLLFAPPSPRLPLLPLELPGLASGCLVLLPAVGAITVLITVLQLGSPVVFYVLPLMGGVLITCPCRLFWHRCRDRTL